MNRTDAVLTEVRNRTDAVKIEVRKLASSKPVHAAAGAGALASAALRDLPARISRWRTEAPGLYHEYVATARTKAVHEYDRLATHGERVMHSRPALDGKNGAAEQPASEAAEQPQDDTGEQG
jgi:hypothetical protein